MRHFVIGDVHGAGEELAGLLVKMQMGPEDRGILVGDVFDRGLRADLVWDLIVGWNLEVFRGNHEQKMLKWFDGQIPTLPPHYYVALNVLSRSGIDYGSFHRWLAARPLLREYDDFIVAHAAVDPVAPNREDLGWNVYGNGMVSGQRVDRFWEHYKGSKRVVYGHLVTGDLLPRLGKGDDGEVNSVGLDTAACHGGPLTGYCVETGEFFSFRSGVNWFDRVKKMRETVDGELMEYVRQARKVGAT